VDDEDEPEVSLDQMGADHVTGDELAAAFEQYLADRDERTGEN